MLWQRLLNETVVTQTKSYFVCVIHFTSSHYIISAGYITHFYVHFIFSKRDCVLGLASFSSTRFYLPLQPHFLYSISVARLLLAIISWEPSQTQLAWRTIYSHLIYTTVSLGTELTHMGTFCSFQFFSVLLLLEVWIKTQGSSFPSWREW